MSDSPLAPYLAPDAREVELERLSRRLGAEVLVLGCSVQGRPIRAIRLPRARSGQALAGVRPDPAVLVCANIHGVELIATRVALGFVQALAAGSDPRAAILRRRAEVWVVPSVNPDGYARTWQRRGQGRLSDLRPNAHGVDLNRNFPLPAARPWYALSLGGWATGSPDPRSPFYRGPRPLSEPETAALDTLFVERGFHAGVNLHSCMGRLLPPFVSDSEDYRTYGELCAAFAAAQPRPYRRLASQRLNWFTGEQEDHQHHAHRTWTICVEHFPLGASYRQHLRAPSTFWRFNPRDPGQWVDNDVPGILAFFLAALERPRPSGPRPRPR